MTGSVVRPDFAVEFSFSTPPFDSPSWEDETSRVRSFTLTRGRQQDLDAVQPGTSTVELDNAGRRFDPYYTAGPHYGDLLPGRRGRIRATYGATGLSLPGSAGAYASTPDPGTPADLDVIVDVAATDWTPSSDSLLVGQLAAGPTLFSFALILQTTGDLRLLWTTDGTLGTIAIADSNVLGLTAGDRRLLRATLDVNNGGGSREVKFWTSSNDGASWTQIGSTVTGAVTSIYNSTAALAVGGYAGGNNLSGTIYRASVSSTIGGTPYSSPRFTNGQRFTGGASSGTDPEGNVWTLAGTASLPAATRDLFGGFVSGWPVPGLDLGRAPVELTDGFSLLSSAELSTGSPLEAAITDLAPVHWWKLDEADDTTTITDSGSDPWTGVLRGAASGRFGATGLDPGSESTAYLSAASPKGWIEFPAGFEFLSIVFVCQISTVGTANQKIWQDIDGERSVEVGGTLSLFPGQIECHIGDSSRSTARIDDGLPHVVVIVTDGSTTTDYYIDGVLDTTAGPGSFDPGLTGIATMMAGSATPGNDGLVGTIQHVALFDYELSATEALRLSDSGDAWAGESITDRVGRLLDLAGWPSSERDLDESSVSSIGAGTIGSNTLEDLRVLEASEGGLFYVDPDFTVRFRNRYFAATSDRSKRARFTFTDEAGPDRFRFVNPTIGAQGDWIRNRIVVDYAAGSLIVEDPASIAEYGIREHSISTVLATAAEARNLGEFVLYRYSTPAVRIRSLELDLAAEPIGWEPALELELGDRVRIQWTPAGIGDPIEVDALVDGKEIRAGTIGDERATFWFSGAELVDLWIWGLSSWGSSTTWG